LGEKPVQPDWTAGYVSEIDYTYGYYRELAPAHLRLALLLRGIAPPASGPVNYLELGFGQGVSINMHAATNRGNFWGTDFNPNQAAGARALAQMSGNGATLLDAGFAELAARDDLPKFDIIALHGIWTWVSDENRAAIVAILRKHLNVGGAVYMSFNTLPGWAAAMPIRELMKMHEDWAGSAEQGIQKRIQAAIAFGEALDTAGANYFRQVPGARERLKGLKDKPTNYLAHEYFNADWKPMYLAEAARLLEGAKLSLGASANLLDHIENINLGEPARNALAAIQHPMLRESARDYLVNQVFRRDIFVRGQRTLSAPERTNLLMQSRVALLIPAADIPLKLNAPVGEVNLAPGVYTPMIEALAADNYRPKQLSELVTMLSPKKVNPLQIIQAVTLLIGAGHAGAAQSAEEAAAMAPAATRLNAALLARAREHTEIMCMASPVLGAAVSVPRLQQMFMAAMAESATGKAKKAPDVNALAKAAWGMMLAIGQRVVKDGKALQSEEENVAQLVEDAKTFLKRLPVLQALGVAPA
jgi:hypothetical protein